MGVASPPRGQRGLLNPQKVAQLESGTLVWLTTSPFLSVLCSPETESTSNGSTGILIRGSGEAFLKEQLAGRQAGG